MNDEGVSGRQGRATARGPGRRAATVPIPVFVDGRWSVWPPLSCGSWRTRRSGPLPA